MLNLAQVTQDIHHWIETFLEVANPALGGWAPCPYARRARLDQDFEIRIGDSPVQDLQHISSAGLLGKSVVIMAYDPSMITHKQFSSELEQANREFLLPNNLLALEDHPADLEIVNGVCMNQGTYALALVQSLSDLNQKAQIIAKKGFYKTWPEQYLQLLFQHRIDPRT